jgi:copper(I)-binding protein
MRIAAALCIVLLTMALTVAHGLEIGALEIINPWSRATPLGATVGGGYLKVKNNGGEPDYLMGGTTDVSARAELHEMRIDNGIMKMRPLPAGIEIKPGATVELSPGALHLMFVGLKRRLVAGERVKGTLVFKRAGTVDVEYVIEAMGDRPTEHMSH